MEETTTRYRAEFFNPKFLYGSSESVFPLKLCGTVLHVHISGEGIHDPKKLRTSVPGRKRNFKNRFSTCQNFLLYSKNCGRVKRVLYFCILFCWGFHLVSFKGFR